MTAARWLAIDGDFRAACDHFSRATQIFDMGGFDSPGLEGYKVSMSFMHAMQSGHTSLEKGLLRILELLGEDRPVGQYWHMDLLNQVGQPVEGRGAVFPHDVCEHAHNTRRFRNVATRSYERFDPPQATIAVASAKSLVERLDRCLRDFKLQIDPPGNDGGGDGSGGSMAGGPPGASRAGVRGYSGARPGR